MIFFLSLCVVCCKEFQFNRRLVHIPWLPFHHAGKFDEESLKNDQEFNASYYYGSLELKSKQLRRIECWMRTPIIWSFVFYHLIDHQTKKNHTFAKYLFATAIYIIMQDGLRCKAVHFARWARWKIWHWVKSEKNLFGFWGIDKIAIPQM